MCKSLHGDSVDASPEFDYCLGTLSVQHICSEVVDPLRGHVLTLRCCEGASNDLLSLHPTGCSSQYSNGKHEAIAITFTSESLGYGHGQLRASAVSLDDRHGKLIFSVQVRRIGLPSISTSSSDIQCNMRRCVQLSRQSKTRVQLGGPQS